MELAVLVDNNTRTDTCLISEHGLSFYIQEGNKKILFDCGSTDAFIKNAYKIDIDLELIDYIVLSHSHADHIGGFFTLQSLYQKFKNVGLEFKQKNIYSHPYVFNDLPEDIAGGIAVDNNLSLSKDKLEKFFNLNLSAGPINLTPKLFYLGEIPITQGEIKNDYAPDEVALAYKSYDGLVIISGCSHSGVENIMEHAKKVTGEKRISTIIGGFYLVNRNADEINSLGQYLQNQHISHIYPCHCTDLESKIILSKYVKIKEVSVGKKYTWT